MQVISNQELQQIIDEAKAAGKDVSALERTLQESAGRMAHAVPPPVGEIIERETEKGTVVIDSTGPARAEDFE